MQFGACTLLLCKQSLHAQADVRPATLVLRGYPDMVPLSGACRWSKRDLIWTRLQTLLMKGCAPVACVASQCMSQATGAFE